MEPKILEEDRDEWIYNSMKKYSNLYMFELEFPADVFEVIDETSICLSGCQPYSKKTEILQLALPPKLFPKDVEEGLCKDRDFQIVSGGYASSNILEIKPIKSSTPENGSLVACTQAGEASVTLYQLGNEDTAVIKESCKLLLDPAAAAATPLFQNPKASPGVIVTTSGSLFLANTKECSVLEWDLNSGSSSSSIRHTLSPLIPLGGRVTKMKLWDVVDVNTTPSSATSVFLLGDNGVLLLQDLRSSSTSTSPPISFRSSRSTSLLPEGLSSSTTSSAEILYSFDTLSTLVGLIDSYGGYETFDVRNPSCPATERMLLPFFGESGDSSSVANGGILRDKFNLQYSPNETSGKEGLNGEGPLFLVSGLDSSAVHVLQGVEGRIDQGQGQGGVGVASVFAHDGHFKRVTAAVWHPSVHKLVFSASVDSMLHAWQYI